MKTSSKTVQRPHLKIVKNADQKIQPEAREVDVLYQRIFNKWYAFSLVDDECLMTEVPEAEISKHKVYRKPAA